MIQEESSISKIWRLIYPMFMAMGVQLIVSAAAGMIIAAGVFVNTVPTSEASMFTALSEASIRYAVLITGIACLITIPLAVLFFKRDIKLCKITLVKKKRPAYFWPLLIASGILTCIGSNIIITISQLEYIFSDYKQVSESLYSGNFIIQLIVIGFIAPICEELIFRGLIYNRAKSYFGPAVAAVTSAFMFAFYHGNMLQFIYAFIIGFMMAYLYEKSGTFLTPVIFHICCNLPALILQQMHVTINSLYTAAYVAAGCVGAVIVLFLLMRKSLMSKDL